MCGIAGVWGDLPADITAMQRTLDHRGPDDRGIYSDGFVTLAMTRLAIQDPSEAGHQPMVTADGQVVIVFNGEMYNFREERARLLAGGQVLRSAGDTEVVLHLYLTEGDNFLCRLRGMFALAIFDRRGGPGKERLLLARDQFGIKPLLYANLGENVLFASELKAMLASGVVDDEVDPVALWQLLSGGSIRQPRTLLKSVRMLPAAHRLVLDRGGMRLQRYWSLGTARYPGLAKKRFPEIVEIVDATLADAVASQLVADVPVGAFLSGGVDSALLVGLMTRYRPAAVRTFSVGFGDDGAELDETDDAALVAAHLGTEHTRVVVTGAAVRNHIEKIARALDQPTVDGVNSYFISRAAASELKVAISGTGSDEIFAGYPWFGAMREHTVTARKRPVRSWFAERFAPYREDGFLGAFAMQYRIFGSVLADGLLACDMREGLDAERNGARDVAEGDELPRAGVLDRTSALVLRGYTVNQLLRDIDAASMAHSLEVRVPFLDVGVADLAFSLPECAKLDPNPAKGPPDSYRSTGIKRALVAAARPMLPPNFDKRAKRGFGMPFAAWLRGPLRGVLHDCLSTRSLQRRGWFEVQAARGLLQRFEAGEESWARPWLVMMTELWARGVLDKAASRAQRQAPGSRSSRVISANLDGFCETGCNRGAGGAFRRG
jgi:asparagine synthase (glutamine-hydrolysing)